MGLVFSWWLAIEILGLVGMPLTSVVCAYLPDRGWALGKPFALLIVGWLIWFPLSVVTALPYNGAWIVGTFLVFAGLNLLLLRRSDLREHLRQLITTRPVYIATSEAVFTAGFLLLAWIRSFNPAVLATEKFMDVAFLSSLVRTQHLPPPDPWLSGASINYYYFGHFLLATVAKVLRTQPGTAFNLGIAVIFGLVAAAVFGVATNLSAALRADKNLYRALPFGLFSLLLVLVLGNLNGAQVWWQQAIAWTSTLAGHGQSPFAWFLHRDLWTNFDIYWDPSRVINPPSTINEFPAFSFLLSDLHAHVCLPYRLIRWQ
jgi:YYY domain-containing protein